MAIEQINLGTVVQDGADGDVARVAFTKVNANFADLESRKVEKVDGKQLSTEDYTSAEKMKLGGIESGAQVNTVTSVAGKTGAVALVKGDVGLDNVDNTSDANKPVSTATQSALDLKANASTQTLNLVHLAYGVAGAVDLAGQAVKEAERNVNFRIQSGEVTVTQADSPAHTRTYASAAVTLPRAYRTTDYQIEVECIAAAPFLGCEGQVQVQSRSTNGFVLAITGSATSATLRWKAINPNAK